mmetsp:Transcript_28513/g.44907  ORF Transcript_28513/g.44907 Transcript_28513/m.44907 type:complete len:860 (-) Transcript_28513:3313-5892(-)
MSDFHTAFANALESTNALADHLDEDSTEYMLSILLDDPTDEDAREAVTSIISSVVDEEGVCDDFFAALDAAMGSNTANNNNQAGANDANNENELPRLLDNAITLKSQDITSFASGLIADKDPTMDDPADASSDIQSFYASMIDVSNVQGRSERDRRKARQKEIRERMEEEERKRAIDDAMRMMAEEEQNNTMEGSNVGGMSAQDMSEMTNATDNAADVRLENFHLANRKGGGQDLLEDASLILARGRRYGLMGRNGCGKTTLLTALASRELNEASAGGGGVPKNMSMLLVRQEIMGNELSAVEMVLKSDVKREGAKRYIEYIEEELTKLDNPDTSSTDDKKNEVKEESSKAASSNNSKAKQKLRDRKKGKMVAAASAKAAATIKASKSKNKETNEEKRKKLNAQLNHAYERLARIEQEEGGDPEPRARKVLYGLGFLTEEMQNKPTSELSGGWRMRVSLSCALFANPALLLLDEPTNHLDLETVLWLQNYLIKTFKGTLVVVSHDRFFLNEVVTDVCHFHKKTLTTYRGDINNFTAVLEENKNRQMRLFEQQEAKREHLQKYIDLHAQAGENGVKAAKQRKSRMKKLDKLGVMSAGEGRKFKASYDGQAEEIEAYEEDEEVVLNFPDPGSFDKASIVTLERVSFGYTPEKRLLENAELTIDLQSRVGLLGRNGCGKSTLIKLIVGAIQPNKGKVSINGRAKIEYLAQHQLEQLDPDSNPMEHMLERYPGDRSNATKMELRRYLANYGLGGDELPLQKISTMSGGQKCRLCMAAALYRKPHLLILDEPTNHLDLETTEALIKALKEFKGGVVLVSHDQHLLTKVIKELYVVDGTLEKLRQGMTEGEAFNRYKKDVVQGRR